MVDRRLSEEEAAAVFRRASELDEAASRHGAARGDVSGFGGLDRIAVERAAVEVGMTAGAVRQALAELDAGVLAEGRPAGALTAAIGGGWPEQVVAVDRVVAGRPRATEANLEAWLKRQTMRVSRRRGPVSVWEPAEGITAKVMRGTDLAGRLRLKSVTAVTLCVLPHDDGARVRIELDFLHVRRKHRGGAIAGLAFGGLAAAGSLAGVVLGVEPALLAAPVGGAVAAGSWIGARRELRKSVVRSVQAVELCLDELDVG